MSQQVLIKQLKFIDTYVLMLCRLTTVLIVPGLLIACSNSGEMSTSPTHEPFPMTSPTQAPTEISETLVPTTEAPPISPTSPSALPCMSDEIFYRHDSNNAIASSLHAICLSAVEKVVSQRILDQLGGAFSISGKAGTIAVASEGTISIYDRNGQLEMQIDDDTAAKTSISLSPDGEYVVLVDKLSRTQTKHLATGTVSQILNTSDIRPPDFQPSKVSWLPNAKQISLFTMWDGGSSLNLMDINCNPESHACVATNQSQVQIPKNISLAGAPAWSPNSITYASICFGSDPDHTSSICILNIRGEIENVLPITALSVVYFGETLSWSPKGDRVAFSAYSMDTSSSDIYIVDIQSLKVTKLFSEPGYLNDLPLWMH